LAGWVVDDLERAVVELHECGVVFEEYDFPGLRTVDGIAELAGVERAAWFRDSEGTSCRYRSSWSTRWGANRPRGESWPVTMSGAARPA
jgi:hypothetical protein